MMQKNTSIYNKKMPQYTQTNTAKPQIITKQNKRHIIQNNERNTPKTQKGQ